MLRQRAAYACPVTYFTEIAQERLAIADVLDGLTPEQWETPSLCGHWTVRELTAHLVVPFHVSLRQFGVAMMRARGSFDRANRAFTASQARRPTAELVADYRAHATSRFVPPGMPPVTPLAEVLIHGQDLRIPLGINDTRDPNRWAAVLDFLVGPKARRGFVPARPPVLELVATDVDWRHGEAANSRAVVRGPAYAIALALTRRAPGLDALDGPGVAELRAWMW